MRAEVFDTRPCLLGEGPLWHPGRGQLFWFDILGRRLLSRAGGQPVEWQFGDMVSAAAWIDDRTLLLASERALLRFDIGTGESVPVVPLEEENAATRSNDGRADPFGGFWIGTMGKSAEPGAGAIYRYFRGRIERLFDGITIPNSICFSPDGRQAYLADTTGMKILRQPLDDKGWPKGNPAVFVDLAGSDGAPDGSVIDAEGAALFEAICVVHTTMTDCEVCIWR